MLNSPAVKAWFKQLRTECAWASSFGKRTVAKIVTTGESFTFAHAPMVRFAAQGLLLHRIDADGSCSLVADAAVARRLVAAASAGDVEVRVHHVFRPGSKGVAIYPATGALRPFEPSCMATDEARAMLSDRQTDSAVPVDEEEPCHASP